MLLILNIYTLLIDYLQSNTPIINYLSSAKYTKKPVIALFGDPLVVFEKLFLYDNNGPFAYLCRSNGSIRTKLGVFFNPLSKIKAIKKGPYGPFK